MKANKQYTEAIDQAKINFEDVKARGADALGGDALEFMDSLLTAEEIAASDLRVAMMSELAHTRADKGISQKRLEEMSGVKQPIIARMERGYTSPQLDTVLKVLAPLGKTLYIGDLPK
jgi:predicted XRE-type DNA-binding protein